MGELIILIFVIGVIASIIDGIVDLVKYIREHIFGTIIFLLIVATIAYCIISDHPFAFVPVIARGFVDFLWKITYKHTIFDSIWIYSLITIALYLFSSLIVTRINDENVKLFICMIIDALAVISAVLTRTDYSFIFISAEIILSLMFIWIYTVRALLRTGLVEDVTDNFRNIEKPNILLSLFTIFISVGSIDFANTFFETSIPKYIPNIILGYICICFQLKWVLYVFKAYRVLRKHTKHTGLFYYNDILKDKGIQYLNNPPDYISSAIEIMRNKKKIYALPYGNQAYINQSLKLSIEKGIINNFSSDEIENKIDTDFKDIGFDNVYKTVFLWTKGFDIEFPESIANKYRKNTKTGIGATEFVLMRYPLENHPLLNESIEERQLYISALDTLVNCDGIDKEQWDSKINDYKSKFAVDDLTENTEEAVLHFSDSIRRKEKWYKTVKTDYSYLLLLEAVFFRNLLTIEDITYRDIEEIFELLKINRRHRDFVYRYIKEMYINENVDNAEELILSNLKMSVRKVVEHIHRNLMWNVHYVSQRQYNVAVCATMSAGKSTFINSMLGNDFVPSANVATTAKVTTIRDNDTLGNMIGCYSRNDDSKVYSNDIDRDKISQWNKDDDIREMILEGNIEEITCQNSVLVMHDTPGTNFAGDPLHHDRTIGFIKDNDLDLLIYLVNADKISVNDSVELLQEILEIEKNRNTKIIFGVNKIDGFDDKNGDDLAKSMDNLCKEFESFGISKPVIFPFSAYAARLFKMVINGKTITANERIEFKRFMKKFSSFDATKYIVNATGRKNSEIYQVLKKDKIITVGKNEYNYNSIITALQNTGILSIENWISGCMEQINVG